MWPEALLVDRREAPPLADGVHAQYVDNFIAFALDPGTASAMAAAASEKLRAAGLPVHDDCVGRDVSEVLGWNFEATRVAGSRRRR